MSRDFGVGSHPDSDIFKKQVGTPLSDSLFSSVHWDNNNVYFIGPQSGSNEVTCTSQAWVSFFSL
jgi:hypothetical protein